MVELARYYLDHPQEREEIAEEGRKEVLKKHTYDHRTEEMLKIVFQHLVNAKEKGNSLDHHNEIKKYTKPLEKNPEDLTALLGLVKVSFELNRLEIAERYLSDYLSLHPANLNILYSLSEILFKQGKYKETQKTLQKILIFEPQHKDAKDLLNRLTTLHRANKTAAVKGDYAI
jgi:tetratricopeptide (TPR) repeat protein